MITLLVGIGVTLCVLVIQGIAVVLGTQATSDASRGIRERAVAHQ
jgi:hypothetical protein